MGQANSGGNSSGYDALNPMHDAEKFKKLGKGDVKGYFQHEVDQGKMVTGTDTRRQEEELKKAREARQNQYGETRGVLDTMENRDEQYIKNMQRHSQGYINEVEDLRNQARDQATDARQQYTNQIQPRFKDVMEDAGHQAGQAMSLQQAGDPNNQVHQAVRGMYNQQADNYGRRGLADVGVLNALGAQATAQQFGMGGPMTGAQQQLMMAANQQQSGAAFARTQQQMDRLRQQGIERGFQESDAQYARGQQAKDRYERSIGNYEGAMDRNIGRQRAFRGEDQGYSADIFGTKLGRSRDTRDTYQGISNRDIAGINQKYGGKLEGINQNIALQNAQNASTAQITGGVLGAAGSIGGAYFGGPAGAQAGGNAGRAMGGGATAAPQAGGGTNYQMYNYGPQPAGQQQPGYYNYGGR